MRRRPIKEFRPALDSFEERQLLSAGALASHAAQVKAERQSSSAQADASGAKLPHGFLGFRVTNPSAAVNYLILPPLKQVLVQKAQPVPGQTYNVLQVAVRNGTSQTFTAANNFTVRLNTNKKDVFPVLTGNEQWAPKQIIVFYILTKNYYPLPQTYGGFQLDLGGRSSTLVPGPSAIFLRLKYNPATFANALDIIVAGGQGNQGGRGSFFGIPNTSINNIVSANTNRNDFGGHF
jgi:hypothetical protein